ncbi:hypothetical protein [Oceanirhabdus sp. W0125-5]|uniref:hypothetical protein n=1 Tax=Oceanirhabdus sp. W0125-5 TaxID=2999116 RepID=UPI0022F333FA|nr:hypothetical protein [Oceanirhabdus sp. W0125-5]WBW98921.1 hypothetical protein OW730_09305 [Oceanirhabdus sp. W0125-5]
MSRCRCHTKCYGMMPTVGAPLAHGGFGTGCCNFSSLVILILILLFFGRGLVRRGPCEEERGSAGFFGSNDGIFGGIIFIITLYFLSCCGPGRRGLY